MESIHTKSLKSEVEIVFGRKVLFSTDCHELSDDIFQKTGSKLSFNTLRRFFHLMKTDFSPSPSTLNILAKYCDYPSYNHFLVDKLNKTPIPDEKGM
jgi:hypothetical protein